MSDAEFAAYRAALMRSDLPEASAEQIDEAIENLSALPTTPEQEAELLALLPPPGQPDAPLNVLRSLRLPVDLNQRLEDAAASARDRGVGVHPHRHRVRSVWPR